MVFDDYEWLGGNPDKNNLYNPYTGINLFCNIYKDKIEIIIKNWQVIIKKITD